MTLDGWNFLFKMLRRKLAEIEAFYGERIKIKAESKVWNFPSYFSLFFFLYFYEKTKEKQFYCSNHQLMLLSLVTSKFLKFPFPCILISFLKNSKLTRIVKFVVESQKKTEKQS